MLGATFCLASPTPRPTTLVCPYLIPFCLGVEGSFRPGRLKPWTCKLAFFFFADQNAHRTSGEGPRLFLRALPFHASADGDVSSRFRGENFEMPWPYLDVGTFPANETDGKLLSNFGKSLAAADDAGGPVRRSAELRRKY